MRLSIAGRSAGVAAAVMAAIGWIASVVLNPYAPTAEGAALLIGATMVLACVIGAGAAARGAHIGMYLLFLVAFLPQGLFTLTLPGVFQAIGWCNLLYLASAVVVHATLPPSRPA